MPEVDNRDPVQHGARKSRHRPFDEITEHTRRREYDQTLLGDADKNGSLRPKQRISLARQLNKPQKRTAAEINRNRKEVEK